MFIYYIKYQIIKLTKPINILKKIKVGEYMQLNNNIHKV